MGRKVELRVVGESHLGLEVQIWAPGRRMVGCATIPGNRALDWFGSRVLRNQLIEIFPRYRDAYGKLHRVDVTSILPAPRFVGQRFKLDLDQLTLPA
ncbi:MAG: hypothetical protein DRJ03_05310 [Chloroflexi bacterium]|nr:MAG: hypothetical protein DRJ03_05310 [Chloroflexota bacterium]